MFLKIKLSFCDIKYARRLSKEWTIKIYLYEVTYKTYTGILKHKTIKYENIYRNIPRKIQSTYL